MVKGGYYVKENDTHGYSKLCLLPEAAALMLEGLLQTPNSVTAWKAIIQQLEDQLTEGPTEPGVVATQATGLAEFALWIQQTPYATTPMWAHRHVHSEEGDETASKGDEGTLEILQRLEDSIVSLWGEIGVWAPAARYITLHGGVGELGGVVNALQQEVSGMAQGVSAASAQAVDARDEARLAQGAVTALGGEASRAFSHLCVELADVKSEQEVLESTMLTLSAAVTSLMEQVALGPSGGVTQLFLDKQFRLHDEAVNSRLDTIRQEMKGGGITVGGVRFSGREAAMDWARINLSPNTYQCIGGMIYAMCLISEAVVHQEDMMKWEEHGKRVKRTFMQLVQVLLVHTSYPPVLDGAKAVQQDGKVDFGELKSYKQWKPINREGMSKKLKEGVERSFDLIMNAINSTFPMKPQARMLLLDLMSEFKVLFHELFVMEVNLFYEETLNKVGGKHPTNASKTQCRALVNKLLRTVFKATHGAHNFATEAGGPRMDPLQTNGYFLYAALEELRVLKEFSKVKWRCHEDFGYNMLGFVFKNSVSKAVLDARPNTVLKMIGLDEQVKAIRALVDHIQTNLAQVWAHGNMAAMKLLGKKAKKDGVEAID
jgi:hypothetical protein